MAGSQKKVDGVGLGFRRDLADRLIANSELTPDFIEFAPENWMNIGGYWGGKLRSIIEKYPVTCHGLSLSLGSPEPLDWDFLNRIRAFFREVPVQLYSEHLSYCKCNNAHLYDLLPIPFREDAVKHVSERIRQVQDFLGRRIAIENVSYYTEVSPEMDESEFLSAVLSESDCDLLLDVNNVYVNAFNHKYDPRKFILSLDSKRIVYMHMAGHEQKTPDLIIDTHGAPIANPVYDLFEWALDHIGPVPVLLERDFNFNDVPALQEELLTLKNMCANKWSAAHAA